MNNMQVTIDGMNGVIQSDGQVRFGSDTNTNVIFYKKSIIDPVKSREQGRPFFVSVDYIRIQQPGEPLNVVDRPVRDDPRVIQRWPQHYQRFQDNQEEVPEGTPVEMLFPNHPEIPANLHTYGVHTVEQLAQLTAHALQSIGMGSVEWQGMARKFLDSAKGGQEHHRLVKQLEDLNNTNQVLQNQVSIMKAQLDRLTAAQQGVPPMMIPNSAPTPAQQYNHTIAPLSDNATGGYQGPFDAQAEHQTFEITKPRTSRNKG